jgi:DNA-binding response OmpR family regulator
LPQYDGFAVCREVKSSPETRLIPVVLVTASTAGGDRIQGIECGVDDFLNKPVNREGLLARVRSLLRMKQFTDELENAETVLFSLALSIEAKDPCNACISKPIDFKLLQDQLEGWLAISTPHSRVIESSPDTGKPGGK